MTDWIDKRVRGKTKLTNKYSEKLTCLCKVAIEKIIITS